ncbi:MAG: hypothetical protein AB7C98_01055 [Acidithiobacillus sp.]|jgi:signal transduction protein with GAF and PtsI domain
MSRDLSDAIHKMQTAQNAVEQAGRAFQAKVPQASLNSLYTAINDERDALQDLLVALDDTHRASGSHAAPPTMLRNIGRAIEWGAGFGIGEDIVNKIL